MLTMKLSELVTRCKQRCDLENSSFIDGDEWKGLIASAYRDLHAIFVNSGMRYYEHRRAVTTVSSGQASGTLTAVAKANLIDGETFTLHDGYGTLVFEFDVGGTGVLVPGNVQLDVSGDTTADDVGATIETAIGAATHDDGTAFKISASNSSGVVTLTNSQTGSIGNTVSANSVANTGFALTDMTGGGGSYRLPKDLMAVVGVDYIVNTTTGERDPLFEKMHQERAIGSGITGASRAHSYAVIEEFLLLEPTPPAGQTYELIYIPHAPDLSTAPTSTDVRLIAPCADKFLVWTVAVEALSKEDSDTRTAERKAAEHRAMVEEWALLRAFTNPRRRIVEGDYETQWHRAWSV